MEGDSYALNSHEIVLEGKYKVHREEGVYPAVYQCSQIMEFAGITQDFLSLLSNAGLDRFLEDLPYQYVILSMSVVQNFYFKLSSSNPTVHYTIYNKSVDLPFGVFCSVMRVPNRGSMEKPKGNPSPLMDVYE